MAAGMNGVPGPTFKPMDLGELLDHSFKVFRRGWRSILTVGLIATIPSVLATGLTGSMTAMDFNNPNNSWIARAALRAEAGDFSSLAQMGGIFLVVVLVALLAYPLVQGAVIAVCSRTYLGHETTPGAALRIALSRYPAMLGTMLLAGLLPFLVITGVVVLGIFMGMAAPASLLLLILIVPAMFVGLMGYAVYVIFSNHAVIVEGAGGGFPAMKRSFQLISGRFWPLLGIGIVFGLLTGVVNSMASFILVLPIQLVGVFMGPNAITSWATAILSGLIAAVTMPFQMIGLTLAYYDTRMRKEGFDLELLAQSQLPPDGQL